MAQRPARRPPPLPRAYGRHGRRRRPLSQPQVRDQRPHPIHSAACAPGKGARHLRLPVRGRIFPAIGLGQDDPREYEALGTRKEDRGRRVDEALPLLRRLWTEDNVTHHGEFFTLNEVTIEPKPIQQPCIPLWIGGRSKAAQRRVGRLGDGWLASSATPAEMEEGVKHIFATAADAGREVAEDHMGAIIGFRIEDDRDAAAERAAPFAIRLRPDADLASYSALGPAEDVAALLRDYVAAGITKFVLRPMCRPSEMEDQLRRVGEDVIPIFHASPKEAAAR